jgi:histidyl-tRNA synthetase
MSLENQGLKDIDTNPQVSVLFVNEEMLKAAVNIASKLREMGVETDIDLVGRPLKKQMENASNSKFVVIVAPKEFSSNLVIVKNMIDGKEQQIPINSLFSNVKSLLNL